MIVNVGIHNAISEKFGDFLRKMLAAFVCHLNLSKQQQHMLSFDCRNQIQQF